MVTIRKYRPDDARGVAEPIRETYSAFCRVEGTEEAVQDYVDHYNPSEKSDSEVENIFSRTPIRLVAVSGSRLVGVLRARYNRITNLFVHGDFHRRGIATRLVNRFEKTCLATGLSEVILRGSLYAIPFYEAIGYKKPTGVRNFQGLKAQPMKKKLKEGFQQSRPADREDAAADA